MRGKSYPRSTSLYIIFFIAAALRAGFSDLWSPLMNISYRPDFLVASSIGDRW